MRCPCNRDPLSHRIYHNLGKEQIQPVNLLIIRKPVPHGTYVKHIDCFIWGTPFGIYMGWRTALLLMINIQWFLSSSSVCLSVPSGIISGVSELHVAIYNCSIVSCRFWIMPKCLFCSIQNQRHSPQTVYFYTCRTNTKRSNFVSNKILSCFSETRDEMGKSSSQSMQRRKLWLPTTSETKTCPHLAIQRLEKTGTWTLESFQKQRVCFQEDVMLKLLTINDQIPRPSN